ncbi:MAG: hypothetical protein GY694_08015 [Gammaproteobacteria bacterium]|nr:hypothetical protein [Gammaproteobacteria bacterium]
MKNSNAWIIFFLMVSLFLFSSTSLAREAMTIRSADLKQEGSVNSVSVARLKKNQSIQVGARKGSWYEASVPLSTGMIHGWVRMIDLRFDDALQNTSETSGDSLLGTIMGGQSTQTVGTGVRGLDNEDMAVSSEAQKKSLGVVKEDRTLKESKTDMKAVKEIEKFSSSPEKARFFAKQGNLKTQAIDINTLE